MRILIAPDSFTGTLTATQAAAAIAEGWGRTSPHDHLTLRPMSDGGPGFLDAIEAGLGGTRQDVEVRGPVHQRLTAQLLGTGTTAWVQSSLAAGLDQVPPDRRDPGLTTSLGVGELIAAAIARGARRVVVGVGGTGVCDGGAGLLAGMGATALGARLDGGGADLANLRSVDLEPALEMLAGVEVEVATDVDVPLCGPRGAALGFSPQKGATPDQAAELELSMAGFAQMLGPRADGRRPELGLGAGAGGGIGYALLRLGARRVSGVQTVIDATGLDAAIASSDLVIAGEGAFDWQSLAGKVISGVSAAARERAVPVIVLAGRVDLGRRDWMALGVSAASGVVQSGEAAPSQQEAPAALADLAARVARTWSRRD